MSKWISVKKKLPRVNREVHVWVIYAGRKSGQVTDSWLQKDGTFAMGSAEGCRVTHWMPLPTAPRRSTTES